MDQKDPDSFQNDLDKLYEDHRKFQTKSSEVQNTNRPISSYQRIISASSRADETPLNVNTLMSRFNNFIDSNNIRPNQLFEDLHSYLDMSEFKQVFKNNGFELTKSELSYFFSNNNPTFNEGYIQGSVFINNYKDMVNFNTSKEPSTIPFERKREEIDADATNTNDLNFAKKESKQEGTLENFKELERLNSKSSRDNNYRGSMDKNFNLYNVTNNKINEQSEEHIDSYSNINLFNNNKMSKNYNNNNNNSNNNNNQYSHFNNQGVNKDELNNLNQNHNYNNSNFTESNIFDKNKLTNSQNIDFKEIEHQVFNILVTQEKKDFAERKNKLMSARIPRISNNIDLSNNIFGGKKKLAPLTAVARNTNIVEKPKTTYYTNPNKVNNNQNKIRSATISKTAKDSLVSARSKFNNTDKRPNTSLIPFASTRTRRSQKKSAKQYMIETLQKKEAEEELIKLALEKRNKEFERDCILKMNESNLICEEIKIPLSFSVFISEEVKIYFFKNYFNFSKEET